MAMTESQAVQHSASPPHRNATVAVVGAGDYIGAAIARKFAAEGYAVFMGRRRGEKLAALQAEIEAAGGRAFARSLDARKEEEVEAFMRDAEAEAPLEVAIFNVGANVNFPLLETTSRVFRKVWEMACYAGFLTGREAARHMLPRGRGSIFFTGATAALRGGVGYAAFASAKFGLRRGAVQAQARSTDAAGGGRRGLLAAASAAARRLDLRDGNPPLLRAMVAGAVAVPAALLAACPVVVLPPSATGRCR